MRVVAVDLGASSGRVYSAEVGGDRLTLAEAGRFANGGVRLGPRLHWDILALHRGVLDGLAAAGRSGPVHSVGIDSWAVDYGLVRADGTLLDNPIHHRDGRTGRAVDEVADLIGTAELFRRCGVAAQPFNTIYQLVADRDSARYEGAATALLIPDLLGFYLTGEAGTEVTNASTTGLLGLDGSWDTDLLQTLGIPSGLLTRLREPGTPAGSLLPDVLAETGLDPRVPLTAVASHDTASAVVAVPAAESGFAYLSCGTWSLCGLELDRPVITDDARRSGFTNERGIDGTWRFLRNVMGLWLLQESIRTWERHGRSVVVEDLVAAARDATALRSVIDPDDAALLAPGDMPSRLVAACDAAGCPPPTTPAETTRCILDSLAVAYRRAIDEAGRLSGSPAPVVHLVGGGANNRLLCQMTADACGVPVIAGPVEAAAVGNALVQARALGALSGDRWSLRRHVAAHSALARYVPDPAMTERYAEAADRLGTGPAAAGGVDARRD